MTFFHNPPPPSLPPSISPQIVPQMTTPGTGGVMPSLSPSTTATSLRLARPSSPDPCTPGYHSLTCLTAEFSCTTCRIQIIWVSWSQFEELDVSKLIKQTRKQNNKHNTELQRTDPAQKSQANSVPGDKFSHLMFEMIFFYHFHRFSWEKIH